MWWEVRFILLNKLAFLLWICEFISAALREKKKSVRKSPLEFGISKVKEIFDH